MQELNLFILWQSGEKYINRILSDITDKFQIKTIFEIKWLVSEVCERLNKLYPERDFFPHSPKVKAIGTDRHGCKLYAIVVLDPSADSLKGVNQNLYQFKEEERRKYNTNYLHSSDNENHAFSDLKALMEISCDEFQKFRDYKSKFYAYGEDRTGQPKMYSSDIVEFRSLREVFCRLNQSVKWTFLRNWQGFPEINLADRYGDIDILANDYYETIVQLNARTVHDSGFRVQHHVMVNGKRIPFDIRYIGDKYYDENWEKSLLDNRILGDGFYHLDEEDHFWTLLYHELVQKPEIRENNLKVLASLGAKLDLINDRNLFRNKRRALNLLNGYLKAQGYKRTKPSDKSVHYIYSWKALGNSLLLLKRKLGIKKSFHILQCLNLFGSFFIGLYRRIKNLVLSIK